MTTTITAWLTSVFWKGFALWAGRAGNDVRLAAFVETLIERAVASQEGAGSVQTP